MAPDLIFATVPRNIPVVGFENAVSCLTDEDPKADQPPGLTIPLFNHQLTELASCLALEDGAISGIETGHLSMETDYSTGSYAMKIQKVDRTPNILRTNFGSLASGTASGKSFTILSLIATKPHLEPYNRMEGTNFETIFYLREKPFNYIHMKTNLVVVPHGTTNQWSAYVKNFDNLNYIVVSSERTIKELVGTNVLRKKFFKAVKKGKYDLIIISNTFYEKFFMHWLNYRTTDRVMTSAYMTRTKYRSASASLPDIVRVDDKLKEHIKAGNVSSLDETVEEKSIGDQTNFFQDYLTSHLEGFTWNGNPSNHVESILPHLCFDRLIVDEVDTVKWSKYCVIPQSLFLWMVSSSYKNLLYTGTKGYSSTVKTIAQGSPFFYIMKQINVMPHVPRLFVRSDPEYVKACIQLPPIQRVNILCKSSQVMKALASDTSMNDVIRMLQADDYQGVSQFFNCEIKTPGEVIEAYQNHLTDKIKEKEAQLNYQSLKKYATAKDKQDAMDKTKKEIESFKTQLASVIETVETMGDDDACPICYCAVEKPIMLPCCHKVFCGECLVQSMKCGMGKCGFCKSDIDMKQLIMIKTNATATKAIQAPAEPEVRLKIHECMHQVRTILENPTSKILIFSERDDTFTNIVSAMKEAKITYEIVKGSSAHITAMIKRYDGGDTRVLLLNSRDFGSGLNLQMTSHIIVYHKMPDNMKMQIEGRGQRIGRTCPLTVINLLTQEEMDS